jgi:hypothetical protein
LASALWMASVSIPESGKTATCSSETELSIGISRN